MEDYKVYTGKIRREWTNPDPEMLGWLDAHKVGVTERNDMYEDIYNIWIDFYKLDDGRKVREVYDTKLGMTTLVAIEEEVENV